MEKLKAITKKSLFLQLQKQGVFKKNALFNHYKGTKQDLLLLLITRKMEII